MVEEIPSEAQSAIIRAATSQGARWVKARDVWADIEVRATCRDDWPFISILLTMYLRHHLVVGVSEGELVVWASGKTPDRVKGVLFNPS